MLWRAEVTTCRGPAKSMKSNLSCRANRMSTTGSLSAAPAFVAIFGNCIDDGKRGGVM